MFCNKCGEKLPDDAKFCTKCGYKVNNEPEMGSIVFKRLGQPVSYTHLTLPTNSRV